MLRPVESMGEQRPRRPARPRTPVKTAARSGDRRRLLASLRDLIAGRIDEGVQPRDLAPLSRRLLALDAEIRALDAEQTDPVHDAADTPDEQWTPDSGADNFHMPDRITPWR